MNATLKQTLVQGVNLTYLEQGHGVPVVFVHGAFADHRIWDAQREEIARRYRVIALDQRYFGTAPWIDDGSKYSVATHAADLAAFVEALGVGPVHLVAWSYGGGVALALAAQRADLVRSLFLYEPALGSLVSDPAEQQLLVEERAPLADALVAPLKNDLARAVELFADWVDEQPGSFKATPPRVRSILLDNARTVPLHFAAQRPTIEPAHLKGVNFPVTVAKGQHTRPFFTILAHAAHRCIAKARLIEIPAARHMAPVHSPSAFNAALLVHLASCHEAAP